VQVLKNRRIEQGHNPLDLGLGWLGVPGGGA
jgi:hypothetical protein